MTVVQQFCYHNTEANTEALYVGKDIHTKLIFPRVPCVHYNDVMMGAMASQITSLTIVYTTIYPGKDKKNTKAPRHWPLWGEFTGDRWITQTKGQ